MKKDDALKDIKAIIDQSGLKDAALKDLLRDAVRQNWPGLPTWSTLNHPMVEEVQKATVAGSVALTFTENGARQVVLAEAGDHYGSGPPAWMAPGGFINLTRTPGSTLVPPSLQPESPKTGAAREVEEELRKIDGAPLVKVDPERLKPMDIKTLAFKSVRHLASGFMLELTQDEVTAVKDHIKNLQTDPAYKAAAALQTLSPDSGKPEVAGVAVFPLSDVASGKCALLFPDQKTLFQAVEAHFAAGNVKSPSSPASAPKP